MSEPTPPPSSDKARLLGSGGRLSYVARGLEQDVLRDLYAFLITSSWTLLLLLISGSYVVANAIFAVAYLLQSGSIDNAVAMGPELLDASSILAPGYL